MPPKRQAKKNVNAIADSEGLTSPYPPPMPERSPLYAPRHFPAQRPPVEPGFPQRPSPVPLTIPTSPLGSPQPYPPIHPRAYTPPDGALQMPSTSSGTSWSRPASPPAVDSESQIKFDFDTLTPPQLEPQLRSPVPNPIIASGVPPASPRIPRAPTIPITTSTSVPAPPIAPATTKSVPPPSPGAFFSDPFLQGIHPADDDALKEYTRRRRELLETLNGLHSTGIQNDLDLPQIVVIGSQSVGKSSLIESMSGITLPRDSGTCTRCPMECRLQYAPTWSCKIILRFQYDSRGNLLPDVREVPFGSILYNKGDVERTIKRAQRAILRPSLEVRHFLNDNDLNLYSSGVETLSFSANCVCIRVAGPNVPDLYFYDLPGIIANVRDGENEGDIVAVENIAKSYIARPNCLVLLVISCETDFENQGAGRLVLTDPMLRSRTIGVLTKTDRIEPGTASKWLAMLKNNENRLSKGWFAVKQPNSREHEAGISWERARANEDAFFTSTEPWMSLERQYRIRLGSVHLAESLSTILSDLVSQKLPLIQREVSALLDETIAELRDLPVPVHPDPRREVIGMIRDFTKSVTKHVQGFPPTQFGLPGPDTSLIHEVNGAYDRFRLIVHRAAPRFRPWTLSYHQTSEISVTLNRPPYGEKFGKGAKPSVLSQVPPPTPRVIPPTATAPPQPKAYSLGVLSLQEPPPPSSMVPAKPAGLSYKEMVSHASQDDAEDGEGYILYLDQVLDLAKRSRTRELPGNVPFTVKENLINAATREWNHLAKSCFEEVKRIFNNHLEDVLQENFGKHAHGGLLAEVREVLHALLDERAQVTNQSIDAIYLNEMMPFTQNEHYFVDYRNKLLNRYRTLLRESRGQAGLIETLEGFSRTEPADTIPGDFWDDINTILSRLANRGIRGVGASDLAKLLPSDDMDPALEIMAEVRAYFQVAYKRFSDVVPQQIDTDFLRELASSLDLSLMCMDLSRDRCLVWLAESPAAMKRREDLMAKKRRLESAKEKLAQHHRL